DLDTTAAGSIGGGKCAPTISQVKFCNVNSPNIGSGSFEPQPLGGSTLIEGSVEYHFPLPLGPVFVHLAGAVFVDAGIVGLGQIKGLQTIDQVESRVGAITPGFGVRYQSAVGPIRVDLGLNPNRAENLPVVTAINTPNGTNQIVQLTGTRNF